MSQNLNLLRQNYCTPATVTGKITHELFPLEKECDEGKALLAKAPAPLLDVQEFDPSGLEQTYRDEVTGAELPVFAVFNLEGKKQCTVEITTELLRIAGESTSLQARLPFDKSQAFVRQINERRTKVERAISAIAGILGILPAFAYLWSRLTGTPAGTASLYFLEAWALSTVLLYLVGVYLLERFAPFKKLVITAEFNGILPREAREKARAARDHFDNLYLIVDQQYRWKSELLPDPAPRSLDPLLVGEVMQAGESKFFMIHQFELTEAERYVADEFAVKLT
ncbi:MAG TPA: hypothetical protein VHY59_09735 [Chthoniobacterales bacterium]|nr:hypothetical protein [Chthoniobacterales bacterium]